MSKRFFHSAISIAFVLASQTAFGAVRSLTEEQLFEQASDIITGRVNSVTRTTISGYDYYNVSVIVQSAQKGTATPGQELGFKYWQKVPDDAYGEDSGQYANIKNRAHIKAYLKFDESTAGYWLLSPNGFEYVNVLF